MKLRYNFILKGYHVDLKDIITLRICGLKTQKKSKSTTKTHLMSDYT